MWAIYLCGSTDCVLTALFGNHEQALKWAKENSHNPEGYTMEFFANPIDIPQAEWDNL